MEKITANEILGTVRAGLKMYQAFEHLSKVVAFLEQKEAYEKKLDAEIHNLEVEKGELEEAISRKSNVLSELTQKIASETEALKSVVSNRETTHKSIVSAAEREAASILDKASREVARMKEHLELLRAECSSVEQEINQQRSALESMRDQYNREKKRIIEALA